jgi:ADP-heptose:LPS heptosyltransferase
MQKLALRCPFALGDVVLLTAAVRDLHQCWPGRYQTAVRSGFAEVWDNNPYVSSLEEYDPEVRVIDCDMPLVQRSDQAGKHALHGFIDFLSEQLAVKLRLTDFRGDIHLSPKERHGASPIAQLTGVEVPYWIINAGGKYDCTIKWWDPARFQEVVEHFRGRIQFVQVGMVEHSHPRLRGVIDLRGRTKVRDLIRLVHHANGVVCGVTALMHLAAAVPTKSQNRGARPCVVIAGGREPPHWEAYPGHQFIHTIGALSCCATGGCWRSRTRPLGDGKDIPEQMCVDIRGDLPACMELITAEEVIRRVELYLAGGNVSLLSADEVTRASQATAWSDKQPAVTVPVNFYNAPQAAADFIARIPSCPDRFAGRGIVICAGGVRMFANAWVCIHMLRKVGCKLPIELWHLGKAEMDSTMEELVRPLGVTCIDATTHAAVWPAKVSGGWALKPYAIINSAFEEVLLLDADNVPVRDPEFLFESAQFKTHGAVFWPDEGRLAENAAAWRLFDVAYRDEPEVESGQVLVNKRQCWAPLLLCMWYNTQSAVFYKHVHGDKETFPFAFRRLGVPYAMIPHAMKLPVGAFYQHDFEGARLFQHRTGDKWDLLGRNQRIADFLYEDECRQFLRDLAQRWDGRLAWLKETQSKVPVVAGAAKNNPLKLAVAMGSCPERHELRNDTLRRLAKAGWPTDQVLLTIDERRFAARIDNITHTAWRAFRRALETDADYVLYLEDDVDFNKHLLENLCCWGPLARRELHIGGLCNFGFRELAWDVPGCSFLLHPSKIWGAQALLLSRQMLCYCMEHWSEGPVEVDLKLGHLAAQAQHPFFCHCPSLVQHVGQSSTLGHSFFLAADFDPAWKANAGPAFQLVPASFSGVAEPALAAHG